MWDLTRCKERTANQWQKLKESQVIVKKLTREMDLSNLSLNEARQVRGSHIYADIVNFRDVLDDPTLRRDDFKPLHRYLHTLRIEMRRVVQAIFDGDKIQVQGSKFHGLMFKPYDDDAELAWNSVLLGIALNLTTRKALPKVFPDYAALVPSIGIDFGDTLVANVGVRGDRELISIGRAANYAAKILGKRNAIEVTSRIWSLLTTEQREFFVKADGTYELNWTKVEDAEELLSTNGFAWTVEGSAAKMKETVENLPLADIQSQEAKVLIDLSSLGPKRLKHCYAGSMYVDIDGYTKLIDSLMGNEKELAKAIKLLHLFRYELQSVAEQDFDGLTIQHQGDRMQAVIHLPCDNEDRVRRKVTEMCVSFNSSVEQVLNSDYAIFNEPYHVAIGAAASKTIVIRSGTIGDLDASCLGDGVLDAEDLQLDAKGNEMVVARSIYESVSNEAIRECFVYDKNTDSYRADGLTWKKVEAKETAKSLAAGAAMRFNAGTGRVEFDDRRGNGDSSTAQHYPIRNTSNWGL